MGKWAHKNNIIYDEHGVAFADCRYVKGKAAQIVREHNAVPELLEACEAMLGMHCGNCYVNQYPGKECAPACVYVKYRAVIAKVRGEG